MDERSVPETDRSVANRAKSIDEIESAYARYADWIDRLELLDRLKTGRYRRRQFGDVTGPVLDVACGTGTNFPYFPDGTRVVGIDVSPEMLRKASDRLGDLELVGDVERMNAQSLAFGDDSFETVVSALSTCTFPDPVAALDEMGRVCRPDGSVRLLEHGLSDLSPIARYQEWRADSQFERSGCRLTQDPLAVVAESSLRIVDTTLSMTGSLTAIDAVPEEA